MLRLTLLEYPGSPMAGDNRVNSAALRISRCPLLDAAEVGGVAQCKSMENTDDFEPPVHRREDLAREIGEGPDGARGVTETIRAREGQQTNREGIVLKHLPAQDADASLLT
jgi:hypothetical protein